LKKNFNGYYVQPISDAIFPMRPKPLNETKLDLSKCHVAALEHIENAYRLYDYGDDARGVFRGDDMLVCESIPIYDEWIKFIGILIYNKCEYDREVKDWNAYWDWVKNRNEARWVDQEKGSLDYDQKKYVSLYKAYLILYQHI